MSYLVLYKFSPEIGLRYFIEKNLLETGLIERKVPINVILGHPLFVEGFNNNTPEKYFPVIGVEWVTDTRIEYIGQSFLDKKQTDLFRQQIQTYKDTPQPERSASDFMIDQLTESTRIQKFQHNVESQVIIAGFASGGNGRSTLRALYEALDGVLDGVCHDIMAMYQGVKVEIMPNVQMNIQTDQYGFMVWGFEFPVRVIQPRLTYRTVVHYPENEINKFDVHLKNSNTKFNWSNGLWSFSE